MANIDDELNNVLVEAYHRDIDISEIVAAILCYEDMPLITENFIDHMIKELNL